MKDDEKIVYNFSQTKKTVLEALHEKIQQPGIIRDAIICNRSRADILFRALGGKSLKYTLHGISNQRLAVRGDAVGYQEQLQGDKPGWEVIFQADQDARSTTSGQSLGMMQPNHKFAREIREITGWKQHEWTLDQVPPAIQNHFCELQKTKAEWPTLITEIFPLIFIGVGKIYVKSYLMRLHKVQGLFHNAANEAEIKIELRCLAKTLQAINVIADKESKK